MVNEKLAKSPVLDRIVSAVREASSSKGCANGWHTDAHTDSGSSWHGDAWKG